MIETKWVVLGESGAYDCHHTWLVAIFDTKADTLLHAERLRAYAKWVYRECDTSDYARTTNLLQKYDFHYRRAYNDEPPKYFIAPAPQLREVPEIAEVLHEQQE